MGKVKKTRQCAIKAKLLKPTDGRLGDKRFKKLKQKKVDPSQEVIKVKTDERHMFSNFNTNIKPPYNILFDTNYLNFSIRNKLDLFDSITQKLSANCTFFITECVIGEIQKAGDRFKMALKLALDPRMNQLHCQHKGIYADDCIVRECKMHSIFIVATCDKELRNRLKKLKGVPLINIRNHQVNVDGLPENI